MARSPLETRIPRTQRLLRILRGCLGRQSRDAERSLELIELSAQIAWQCHAGVFVLPHAERMLREHVGLADPLTKPCSETRAVEGRTLHVLTEAYSIGGHTRLVKRWIELLDEEPHAVVLVRQRLAVDPDWIVPVGRDVPWIDLERAGASRRAKVARLMALFRAARRVILHIHPDDACSVAAAYRSPEADIHYLNHADHVAWLGAGLPAVLLNLRHRGAHLAETRRGIAAANCGTVPIPIPRPASADRGAARRQFGIGDRECLVLSIASGYKFTPVGNRSLLEPLDNLLVRRDVKFMVVGAEPGHPAFAPLAERHPGQVLCMGGVPSPALHRAAADIYLDSYPFCSITSMLESAALGTPVVAFQPDPEELDILYSECPWLPADRYAARDVGQLGELLHALIDDSALRQDLSARGIEGMAKHHPEAWRTAIQEHLSRNFRKTQWVERPSRVRESLLDRVLSCLMRDVQDHTDQPQALGLDRIGMFQLSLARRLGWL
ncbi:MAG: hypothetical protein WCJ18_02295 [Planctomycetota bacterium]